ncbi:MAG: chromosomal replication initiator protein DnaA [Ignavibacteriaceae bacterium]|nr:chromosomal replication initiator protein DnaA [Ignavibacteriaceae bacterium]NUM69270.1 chromosomal replication initiator protein DnaA [Ignavibacteriaceae bacterium]
MTHESLFTQENIHKAAVAWKECLSIIKPEVPEGTFNSWFRPIKAIDVNDLTLKIQVPNSFFWEWIEGRYSKLLHKAVKNVLGHEARLDYVILEEKDSPAPYVESAPKSSRITISEEPSKASDYSESNLKPNYTFENFIKGEGNQLATAAAMAISENPGGTPFNPLFVYGGVGLGKTHLIQAAGNSIYGNFPEKKIKYISTEQFTIDFVDAIKKNMHNEFSNVYKNYDVLILDDIQHLIGKEKTQDLFFHIFNIFHQNKKQIIISSDKPPKDLKGLNDRLISRFNWGLTVDIQPPDLETRIAILSKKAESFGIMLSNDMVEYIANHITSNIRELEGCLIKILANVSLKSADISLEQVKRAVKEVSTAKRVNISIDVITRTVAEFFTIDEKKIRDKTRRQEIVHARQVAMYLSRTMTKSGLKNIGLHFGGRDHSTVIHACESVEKMLTDDPSFKDTLNDLKIKIELACS